VHASDLPQSLLSHVSSVGLGGVGGSTAIMSIRFTSQMRVTVASAPVSSLAPAQG